MAFFCDVQAWLGTFEQQVSLGWQASFASVKFALGLRKEQFVTPNFAGSWWPWAEDGMMTSIAEEDENIEKLGRGHAFQWESSKFASGCKTHLPHLPTADLLPFPFPSHGPKGFTFDLWVRTGQLRKSFGKRT